VNQDEEPMTDSYTLISLDFKQQVVLLQEMIEHVRSDLRSGAVDLNRVSAVMTQLASGMHRLTKQVAQLEDDHNSLMGLVDTGQVVNSSLDLDAVLRYVMDTIVRLTGSERGFLMLRDRKQPDAPLMIQVARNWEMESIGASETAISQSVIHRVVSDGQPVITTNAQEDPRFGGQESIIAYNLRSILCVPLKVKEEITGVVYADNRIRTGIFTEAKKNLIMAFANQAAVAIENARLFDSVRRTLAEVTELKNLMDNVFASMASGVITSDIEDRIVLTNKATEKILGRPVDEIVGHRLSEILAPIALLLDPHIETVRKTDQQMVGIEITPILPHRGPVSLSLNLAPLKDAAHVTQGVAIVVDDLTDKRRLEAQRRLFERMVSPKVIDQLDPDQLQLGGRRTPITSLFADVRGFTSYSERHSPEQLVFVLNRYLARAAEAVLAEDGTIDKFLGDAIMAWFNAPIPQPDHSLRAVRAAIGIRESLKRLHNQLPADAHLNFGIGIHFGEAVLGLVGTESRLDYTAIGDSVNTAKRIQENAMGGQILISDEVYKTVADVVEVKEVEPVIAKGKSQPLIVYEVVGMK
jgi:PAS domain S-box-containing protein